MPDEDFDDEEPQQLWYQSGWFWFAAILVVLAAFLAALTISRFSPLEKLSLIPLVLFAVLITLWMYRNRPRPLPHDRFILRNTGDGHVLISPGDEYTKKPEDTEFVIRPDRHLFQTPQGPRILSWQPDPANLEAYREFYRPLRDTARADFIRGAEDFFTLNDNPTVEFLQDRYADHLGIQILALDLPPGAAPKKVDTRSKAEKEIDRLLAGVKTAAEARRRWADLQKDADFSAALSDPNVGPKIQRRYEDVITRITEGDD